ncbi:hypothetical protein ACFQVC_29555 [Streptomyces monticola]|uniref:Lipoprotein n=1 Tax=Streptomyces monticola TaxID=2666263 RepID=A0ABW2JRH9_9ACTN
MLKHVRICAAAAAVAAALALTGCSGDGGGKGKKGDEPAASEGAQETPGGDAGDTGGSGGTGSDAKGGSLDGVWVAVANGKSVALTISKGGKVAALAELGVGSGTGVTCVGKAGTEAGTQMIHLTCKGGGQREMGRVESVDATSMKVAWEGAGTDDFKKTENGQLPEGIPTEGLPQS